MGRSMKFIKTSLAGAYFVEIEPFRDERGLFARIFCQKEFNSVGFDKKIVQINHSITRQKGCIRGLHYQTQPACETKIIRCIQGAVFDVMVDIRKGSPTFLQWHGLELSKDNMRMAVIPEGFAHGFQAITDNVELIYHHSAFYCPEYSRGLKFDDPALAIQWPVSVTAISSKDKSYPLIDHNFKGIDT
jgi:dTDP-4-dehydrorhamnose 3,5-epimerase